MVYNMTKTRYNSGQNSYDADYYRDGVGRVTKLTDWIDGTDGIRYAYDTEGRLTTVTDYDDSVLTYSYDTKGKVTSVNDYHGSTVSYSYDGDGVLTGITAPGSKTWTFAHDSLGRLTQTNHANGMATVYAHDDTAQLTKIEHKDGGSVLDSFAYQRDTGGKITRVTYQTGVYWVYEYDGRNRLTKGERYDASDTLLKRYSYSYDNAENMLSKVVYTPPSTTNTYVYGYTDANELTKQTLNGSTVTNFAYDKSGRMTSKTQGGSTATYAYRYSNKLYSVTSNFSGEGNVTYQYGGDGKRRERTAGGSTTKYNWDAGWNVINEEDSQGTLTMTYVGGLADVSGTDPSQGTWRYYFSDHLGSTRRLRDANKSSLGQYEYIPFGEIFWESGAAITHRFTGYDWDSTAKLYYAPFRYYNVAIAHWISRDPSGITDGLNLFAYVHNTPITRTDPLGLWNDSAHGRYCRFDHEPGTRPLIDFPSGTVPHFRHDTEVMKFEIATAISDCDLRAFEDAMHMYQDWFSHAGAGYTPWTHFRARHTPDNPLRHYDAYLDMVISTYGWEEAWNSSCGKCAESVSYWEDECPQTGRRPENWMLAMLVWDDPYTAWANSQRENHGEKAKTIDEFEGWVNKLGVAKAIPKLWEPDL